jgi:phosphopantothenoylcysteine decarboxylase/phosphopantothenate--cysteine ligase
VRFIGNRSSGRMGFAIAAAAAAAGARVTLIAGPVHLPTPAGVARRVDVRSARQMHEAVLQTAVDADVYVATAAVGDYRPAEVSSKKLKKQGGAPLVLELAENPDIVSAVAKQPRRPFILGFAAETHDVATYARGKLERKGMDMIAANQVGGECGFETDDNALTLYWDGGEKVLPRASKAALAQTLIEEVAARLVAPMGDVA